MNVSAHESAEQTEHTLLSSRGCQAATAGVGNNIITHEGKTHVAWLESRDGGQTFTAKPIINPDPNKGEVHLSIERPTGFNQVGSYPGLLYTSSDIFLKWNEEKLINNNVFWVHVK